MRAILIAFVAFAPATVVAEIPAEAVRFFYENANYETDPTSRDRYVLPARAVLDQHELVWEARKEVCIDFSLAFDAQDFDEAELKRTLELHEEVDGDIANVFATFTLFGQPREIVWSLKRDGGWKISDIASQEGGWRLSEFACE